MLRRSWPATSRSNNEHSRQSRSTYLLKTTKARKLGRLLLGLYKLIAMPDTEHQRSAWDSRQSTLTRDRAAANNQTVRTRKRKIRNGLSTTTESKETRFSNMRASTLQNYERTTTSTMHTLFKQTEKIT